MIAPLLMSLSLVASDRTLADRIVAIVNDDVITLSDLESAAKAYETSADTEERKSALRKDMLDQIIYDRLLTQQIKESKVSVTEDEVDRAIDDVVRQNKITLEQLREAVKTRGMSFGQYRADVETQLVRMKIVDMKVRSRVVIPESDVKAEYERRVRDEKRIELVHIRHIFFRLADGADAAEKERVAKAARAARARVVAGEDFATVAKAVSEGPTASDGGDLGEMEKKSLLPDLARAIEGLAAGSITQPIATASGIHVVEVVARKMKEASDFDELRGKIQQELFQREADRQMKIWLDEVKATSAVDVRL